MIKIASSKELYPCWITADVILDMMATTFGIHLSFEEGKETLIVGFFPISAKYLVPPEDRDVVLQRNLVFSKWIKKEIGFDDIIDQHRWNFGINTLNFLFSDLHTYIKKFEKLQGVEFKEIYKKFMGSSKTTVELPQSLLNFCATYDIER